MPLSVGDKLGPYEILVLIGRGGMGEVYKAHDPRLRRDVAIKTSSQRFSDRFGREARAVAALNHPNICQIYDIGSTTEVPGYLVMELVEGEAPRGPLPLPRAIPIARQIASALDAAHSKSIIHRDLKPENIKVTPDGVVKVLDFGLAKFDDATLEIRPDEATLSMSATQVGTIVGTPAYMSPEQATGQAVDSRTDVWAFGVVLYELLTGERLFKGRDVTETLTSIIHGQPDLTRIPPQARLIVEACLRKDPRQRLRSIGDISLMLDLDASSPVLAEHKPSPKWLWQAAAAVLTIVATAAVVGTLSRPTAPELSARFFVDAPQDKLFANLFGAFSISPNGRLLTFAARSKDTPPSLWVRRLDSNAASLLAGTENANFPFWSPDSKSLMFTVQGEQKLKRVELAGGAPVTLTELSPEPPSTSAGTWNREGVVLYGAAEGIYRISASGGTPALVTHTDRQRGETSHGWPQFLPDGRRFLYFVASTNPRVQGLYLASIDVGTQSRRVLETDGKVLYAPPVGDHPGYLLWLQENTLLAQIFDASRVHLEGAPVAITEEVGRQAQIAARTGIFLSEAGVLAFLGRSDPRATHALIWKSRDGRDLGSALPTGRILGPSLSPDGTKLAFASRNLDGSADVVAWDFGRSVKTQVTFEAGDQFDPVWSPDSKQVAYSIRNKGIYRKDASGAGQPVFLAEATRSAATLDWSPDGKYILFANSPSLIRREVLGINVTDPASKPFPVIKGEFRSEVARFSPDGKWVAYNSNETGNSEVYIRAFTPPGSRETTTMRWQVSDQGGGDMAWSRDGRELYFENGDGDIMAVRVQPDRDGLKLDAPRLLLRVGMDYSLHNFAVSADGQRFLVRVPVSDQNTQRPLTIMLNWQAALKK